MSYDNITMSFNEYLLFIITAITSTTILILIILLIFISFHIVTIMLLLLLKFTVRQTILFSTYCIFSCFLSKYCNNLPCIYFVISYFFNFYNYFQYFLNKRKE